jgi:hypothetical protein
MNLTYKEKKEVMTAFAQDISLDVYTVRREDGSLITVSRTQQTVKWRR